MKYSQSLAINPISMSCHWPESSDISGSGQLPPLAFIYLFQKLKITGSFFFYCWLFLLFALHILLKFLPFCSFPLCAYNYVATDLIQFPHSHKESHHSKDCKSAVMILSSICLVLHPLLQGKAFFFSVCSVRKFQMIQRYLSPYCSPIWDFNATSLFIYLLAYLCTYFIYARIFILFVF